MKISAICGAAIHGGTETFLHGARWIPGPAWFRFRDGVDTAVEAAPATAAPAMGPRRAQTLRVAREGAARGGLRASGKDRAVRSDSPGTARPTPV